MKRNFCLILLAAVTFSTAQEKNFKFGKVSKEEILQKAHPLEADAEAAILYKKERLYYQYVEGEGFHTIREAHFRVKIYKKSGLDWGTVAVPLYTSDDGGERISSIKAYTYNMEGEKIAKVKLGKSGIFKEKVNKYRTKASLVMPEVKEGSVIEVEYQIASDFAGNIDEFKFQYGIPLDVVDVSVEIPEYFFFKRYGRGFYPINLQQSRRNRTINMVYKETNQNRMVGGATKSTMGEWDFVENVYKANIKNIPSLKEVDYTDNIDNYRSAIKFELASTQFPNSAYKNFSLSWEDVAKSIFDFDDFGGELGKKRLVRDIVDVLKAEEQDKTALLQNIFHYVKDNFTWNTYYGVLCENGIKKTLAEKSGNVADINLTLTAMLQYAGFEAHPVLVSTKSHGIPLFPTREGFNYVVTAVYTGQELLLMDATEKMGTVGVLPMRALNWKGRLIKEDGASKEIELCPKMPAKRIVFMSADIMENGTVAGKMRTQLTHNWAYNYRKSHKNETLEDIMDAMEERYLEMEIDGLELKNEKDCDKPLVESCSFVKENQLEVISGKLYFKPALFLALMENPFKIDKREYPVDFGFPKLNKLTVNFKIPEGFQVESMPENTALGLPDGLGNFKYSIQQQGDVLQFRCQTQIKKPIIPPTYYQALKEFYNQIVVKQTENVVLVKT
ncbi:MAG: DUF3857 domain-containing protein [Bacteroidota bacterium]